jgi:hypothetical protein
MTTQLTYETAEELELITPIIAPTLHLEKVSVAELLRAAGTSWSVQQSKGRITGVGAHVSGSGAWARVQGSMTFSTITLETSKTYRQMRESQSFHAGVGGFWSWLLNIGQNINSYKEQLTTMCNELSQSSTTNGLITIDLSVSGQYPGVSVFAEAYILALEVSSDSNSNIKFPVISLGAPTQDTGAHDQNGNNLPVQNNNSTIKI